MLSDECPVALASARLKNLVERDADGAFVRDSELFVFSEFGIVVSDDFVRRFEVHACLRDFAGL